MLQYVNGFSCSLSNSKDNLVLHFIQQEPIAPDDDTESVKYNTHNIASIIMNSDCAQELVTAISELLATPNDNES